MNVGVLGYGYDLGQRCEAIREIDGNGLLTLPWLPAGFVNEVDEEGECALVTAAQKRFLEPPAEFSPSEAEAWREAFEENVGWVGLAEASENATEVAFIPYQQDRWALCAHRIITKPGRAKPVDLAKLANRDLTAWNTNLAEALAKLGMTPLQEKPCWLLLGAGEDATHA